MKSLPTSFSLLAALVALSTAQTPIVEVNFTSQHIEVTEGDRVEVRLRGEAFGVYANPIAIGVICAAASTPGVTAAFPNKDFSFTHGARFMFRDVHTIRSLSFEELVIPIIDDSIAEPCEYFTCTLQAQDSIRIIEPNQVTIRICDDDELVVRWARDIYQITESDPARVELVTDSVFVPATFRFPGFASQISVSHPNHLPSLSVCGPTIPGSDSKSTIEQASAGYLAFGNAQVTQSGRTDVVKATNEFVFTAVRKSAFWNITIVDDDVLEFDEVFTVEFNFDSEISNNWNVRKGEPSIAFIIIRDNDLVTVNFNEDSYSVAESAGQVSVSLRINGRFFVPVWAIVEIREGTATDPEDYSSAVRYNATFCQTAVTDTQTPAIFAVSSPILINITDDDIFEGVEYFQVRIVETSDSIRVRIGQDTVNVTITDVAVRYEQEQYSVEEEAGSVTLALVLDRAVPFPVTVIVNTMDLQDSSVGDAATANVDYNPRGPFQITFPTRSTRQEYTVNIIDDFLTENSEFFNANVNARPEDASIVVIGSLKQTLIEIQDLRDKVVAIFLDRMAYSIFENEQVVTVTLTLNDTYHEDIVVDVAVGELQGGPDLFRAQGNGSDWSVCDMPRSTPLPRVVNDNITLARLGISCFPFLSTAGVDFSTSGFPRLVTIPARQTNVQFIVRVINELIVERDEQFQVSFTYSGGQRGVVVNSDFDEAIITIRNDDDDMSHDTSGWCPTEKDSVWGIQWLGIAAGSIQSAHCPGEGSTTLNGFAYRRCLAGVPAEWGSVDASDCESVAGRAVREKTDEFINSLKKSNGTNRELTDKERKVFHNISQGLNAVLDPSVERNRSIFPQDLMTAARFVAVVADLGENNGLFREESNETEETVADILSNVLDERNAPAFEATAQQTDSADPERGKAATPAVSILQSTERVTNVIGTTLSKTKPSFTIARPNLEINGQRFSFNNLRTGIVFPGAGIRDTLASFGNRKSLPQIHLPHSFLRATKRKKDPLENDTVEVVNVVMNNMENYLPSDVIKQDKDVEDEPEETLPASRVISSQIIGYDGGEVDSKERVEVIFPIHVKSQSLPVPPGMVQQFHCAFFNFTAEEGNQTGGWSYRGVKTHVINTTHVRCIASHLTSFVVLVSIVPSVGEPPALDYITYIGCSISLLCLLACIIFYLTLRKELVERLHNFVHLNLCIALSLGLLFFLTGIQTATANIYACKVMTALLHYFFLATFTWTLCEAVLIYILLVKVFGANDRKWIYLYLALGWVLPIPVVVITGGARHDYYLIRASFDQSHPHYNSIKACWLPSEKGVIFAFIGLMVAIILVNAVLLTISLVSLAKSQCDRTSARTSKDDERARKYMEVGKQLLKATFILVPLLGFTWIIGLFAVGEDRRVFAYLFVIANVFQGLFIFVLHVLRHEKVYGKIKTKLPSIRRRVRPITGSVSSSATKGTHASKSDTIGSKKGGSFALESEGIIEFGMKIIDEDAGSIKGVEKVDIKLNDMGNAGLSCGVGTAKKW